MEDADIIAKSLGGLSYGGIFIVAILSNVVIPVPEELILLAIGYLTGIGVFAYPLVVAIFVLGMLLSDYILYSLSYRGSRLVSKLHKRLEKKGLLKNQAYMRRHIKKIIFFSRFLVYLRFIGPVISGSLKIPRKTFISYDLLALLLYVNIFMGLGNYFHGEIKVITEGVAQFKNYIMTGLVIIVTFMVFRFIQKNFLKWMYAIGEFMPTIIPGLEINESQNKKRRR